MDHTTIIEKFNGKYRTLAAETLIESKRRLCELAGVSESIMFQKLHAVALLPESAGPNTSVAWEGVVEDILAILQYPTYLFALLKWYWYTRSYYILLSFIATAIVALPCLFHH